MESKLIFLVVCCAMSCIKADGHLSTNLTSKITNNECGKTKLCLDNPKGCDPSGSSQCFFTSVTLTNISITVELSGSSTNYIALAAGVTSNVLQDHNIIFVCGNNGSFFFRNSSLFNNTLEITDTLNVISIQGSIQSSLIQCVFSIPIGEKIIFFLSHVKGSNTSNSHIPVFLNIFKGSTNGTELGTPRSVLESSVLVNLTNVKSANAVSLPANTTTSTPANTTTSTPANTTTSTPANTTTSTPANTTTSTPASTTTKTTAHSNANISLTSLLSHAAICLLSIFLQLI